MIHDDQIAQLKHQNQELKTELLLFQARCKQFEEAYEYLQEQMLEMKRQMFGKRSERYIDDPENPQLSLLDDVSSSFVAADAEKPADVTTQVAAHSRTKKSKSEKELPRRIEIVPLSNSDRQCACGACKTVIRYEIKELLDYRPAILETVEQRREVAVCTNGCDNSIVTAPAPLQILPKVKATAEFLSFLVVSPS